MNGISGLGRGIILRYQTQVGLPKPDGGSEYAWIHHKNSPAFPTPETQGTRAPTTLSPPTTI